MRPVRPALLVLLGLLLGFWLTWWHPLPRVAAQGVGFFGTSTTGTRTNCTQITSPVQGQTVCFDQAANTWKVYTGASVTAANWVSSVASQTGVNNVKDFGAKGDDATDDTAAIQAAVNATYAQNGTIVYIPPGTYRVSAPITYTTSAYATGLRVVGAGMFASVLRTSITSGAVFSLTNNGTTTFQMAGEFREFGIASLSGTNGHGIEIKGAWLTEITQVRFAALTGDGIRITNSIGDADSTSQLLIRRCYIRDNFGYGVNVNNAVGVNAIAHLELDGNLLTGNGLGGAHLQAIDLSVTRNSVAQNTGTSGGLHLFFNGIGNQNAVIVGNNFETNSTQHIKIDSLQGGIIANNNFVHYDDLQNFGYRPQVGLVLGDGTNPAQNILVYGNYVRSTPANPTLPTTIYVASTVAANNRILDTTWAQFSGANATRWTDAGTNTTIIDDASFLVRRGNTDPRVQVNGTGVTSAGYEIKTNATTRWDINSPSASADLVFNDGAANRVTFGNSGGVQIGTTAGDPGVGSLRVASAIDLNATRTLWNGTPTTGTPRCTNNCGTNPSLTGHNSAMRVTMGATGTPRSPFLVLFNGTWNATPSCIAQLTTATTTTVSVTNATTTGVTVNTVIGPAQGDVYAIHCLGAG